MGTFIQSMHAGYAGAGSDRKRTFLGTLFLVTFCLKLVSAIFYQILIFSPNACPLKTMKNVFYFI